MLIIMLILLLIIIQLKIQLLHHQSQNIKLLHLLLNLDQLNMNLLNQNLYGMVYQSVDLIEELKTCELTTSNHTLDDIDVSNAQVVQKGAEILYTYSVHWVQSDVKWSERWDVYLSENQLVPATVHWYSITNSILVVLVLSVFVVSMLLRNLRCDISAYNAIATIATDNLKRRREDDVDQSGWKLVHAKVVGTPLLYPLLFCIIVGNSRQLVLTVLGAIVFSAFGFLSPAQRGCASGWKLLHADVFRPPQSYPLLYCVFIGSGAQLALTVLCAIILSAVGFLSPARRGSLINAFLAFYVLLGIVAGYTSSRLYKAFHGRQRQLCTAVTALLYPGISFGMFFLFNIIYYFYTSTASAPVIDVLIVALMWCCVNIPLVFVGAYCGYKQERITFPTDTSTIGRAIPTPPIYLNPKVGMVLIGSLPFAAAIIELFFTMTSLWMNQFYYVFGFTLIVYLILLVTCAETTVLLVHYQLCAENHRWWWFSFFSSGSIAFYTFIYSIFYFQNLNASNWAVTYMVYFGYMFLISFGMLLLFGTVGALTSLWYIRKIFSSIKVEEIVDSDLDFDCNYTEFSELVPIVQ